ncbi:hypothetical protein NMG60_11035076 [Bertholletia excelsa]
MMDLEEKEAGDGEMVGGAPPTGGKKSCSDCSTTTTPLWRVGPAGPKSLCNACGIKYNKKKRALLGLKGGRTDKSKKRKNGVKSSYNKVRVEESLKLGLIKRSEKQKTKLGEEERAAMLLMALSCGYVYA